MNEGYYIGEPVTPDPAATVTIPYKHYEKLMNENKRLFRLVCELSRLSAEISSRPKIEMTDCAGVVPKELCTVNIAGEADDFIGCGHCFDAEHDGDCEKCVVARIFKEYAILTGQKPEERGDL